MDHLSHLLTQAAPILIGLWAAAMLVCIVATALPRDWRVKSAGEEMVYRRPWPFMVIALLLAIPLAVLPFVFYAATKAGQLPGADTPAKIALAFIICEGAAVLLLMLIKPEELRLNVSTRTYQSRYGWPLLAKPVTGSFDDLKGVYVRTIYNSPLFNCCLVWKDSKSLRPSAPGILRILYNTLFQPRTTRTLAMVGSQDAANSYAQQVAATLGVPTLESANFYES